MPEGSKVKFSILPSFEIIETTINEIKELQRIVPDSDVVLMFSCFARLFAFGPLTEDEVKGVNDLWDKPLAGFFSGGEIGSALNEETVFQNEACCVVTLKEK